MAKIKKEQKAKTAKPKTVKLAKPKRVKLVKCFWCDEKVPETEAKETKGKWCLPKASKLCLRCDGHLDGIFHPRPKVEEPKAEEPIHEISDFEAGVYPAHIEGYKKGAVLLKKAAEFARRAGN